jgi:putative toxin-antitoxin system antitoxin component (TIGR02293 family)
MSSFERLCQETSISASRLAVAAGIPLRTLGRRKEQGRLTLAESERVFRLATLFEKATQVLGDRENARQWIASPKKALGGRSPLEYADTEVGAREVEDLLGRLEHGVFS